MINLIRPYVQDAQLAALKEKHKKDQQLRSLKRQLAHRSEYRKRTPDTINTQRKRKYSRVPPHIDASSLHPNLPATLTTPSFDIKQLESTLRPSLVDSAPRDRENDASNAVSDTVPLEYDIKRTHALPLRPNIPTTPTTPTTPSSTPSTPSFDIEQLELALPSPISDSDPFWDLDSTTGTTGTDTDEDQSTAASHTAPLKYDTPPTPPQLKLALPSSIPCSDPCWDMDEDESTAASDTAPLEYHKAGIIADAPLPSSSDVYSWSWVNTRSDHPIAIPPSVVFATSQASIVVETAVGSLPLQSARTGAKVVIAERSDHRYILMVGTAKCDSPLYSVEIDAVELHSKFDVDHQSVKVEYTLPAARTWDFAGSLQLPGTIAFCLTFNDPLVFLSFRYYACSRILPQGSHSPDGEGELLADFFAGCHNVEHPNKVTSHYKRHLLIGFGLVLVVMSVVYVSGWARSYLRV
ncbi:hypothetical protein EYR40_008300 [Pleurotus pulmonarius]|nr:hypothetical protein EYR40_008300 [Pleurotus pulmonarius]